MTFSKPASKQTNFKHNKPSLSVSNLKSNMPGQKYGLWPSVFDLFYHECCKCSVEGTGNGLATPVSKQRLLCRASMTSGSAQSTRWYTASRRSNSCKAGHRLCSISSASFEDGLKELGPLAAIEEAEGRPASPDEEAPAEEEVPTAVATARALTSRARDLTNHRQAIAKLRQHFSKVRPSELL